MGTQKGISPGRTAPPPPIGPPLIGPPPIGPPRTAHRPRAGAVAWPGEQVPLVLR